MIGRSSLNPTKRNQQLAAGKIPQLPNVEIDGEHPNKGIRNYTTWQTNISCQQLDSCLRWCMKMCKLRSFNDHWWIKRSIQNASKNNMLIRNKNGLAWHSCKGPFPLVTSQALWVLTSTKLDAASSTTQALCTCGVLLLERPGVSDWEAEARPKCCLWIGCTPPARMTVTTFGFGHPNLNLHLPRLHPGGPSQ